LPTGQNSSCERQEPEPWIPLETRRTRFSQFAR
jgi:hypothetical protein